MRAFEMPFKYITGIPAADLTEKRYFAVKYDADATVAQTVELAGAGEAICGILQEPNDVNQPAQVMQSGISFCVYGDTVAANDELSVDANGKLVKASTKVVTAKDATDITVTTTKVVAIAVVGGAADEIGCCLLK